MPTRTASIISLPVSRNIGMKNISAPVLMKKGGKIIFLMVVGRFAAFILTNITDIPMIKARAVEIHITFNHSFYLNKVYFFSYYILPITNSKKKKKNTFFTEKNRLD